MAMQEANISISFAKGLSTKVDPKQTMQGSLLSLSNGVFTKVNAINQDPGYLPIPQTIYNSSSTISNANFINTFNNQLVMGDNQYLYNFSETLQDWVQIPTKVAQSLSASAVGSNSLGSSSIGVAKSANGLEFYIYGKIEVNKGNETEETASPPIVTPQGFYVSIIDPVEDNVLYTNSLITGISSASPNPTFNAVVFGTTFTGIYIDDSDALQRVTVSELTPPQTLTITPLGVTIEGNANSFDLVQSATNVYIIYTTGVGTLTISRYDSTFTLLNSVTPGGASGASSIVIDPGTGDVYATWYDGTNVKSASYTSTLTPITAPTIISTAPPQVSAITSVVLNSSSLWIYIQQASNINYDTDVFSAALPALTPTHIELIFNTCIATKAYIYNSQPTINLCFFDYNSDVLSQNVYVTIQQAIPNSNYTLNIPYTVIGKYAEGSSGAPITPTSIPAPPSQVLSLSNTNVIIPFLNIDQTQIVLNRTANIYNVFRLDCILDTPLITSNLANNFHTSGGTLMIYDGAGLAESGFHAFPASLQVAFSTPTVVGTPPPSLSGGQTYSWTVTYEWTDNYGNLHRSAPAIPTGGVALTPANPSTMISQAALTVQGLSLSESYKIFNIQVVFWRTLGNGLIYYRIGSAPNVDGPVTFIDFAEDLTVPDSTQIYTTGGEVDNIAPPATNIIFPYKNRMIAVQADNPYVWWYSKQVIQGFPTEFSDFFTQNIDMVGGPISAGQTMDDKLIFFKNSNIFYVIGDGPAPNGTQNDFSYPQVITSDVGCTNQRSIIVIPVGLMFQSTDKGIYLLDRSLQLSYIGAPVEQFNNIPVTSAQLLPNTTQVRFTLNNGIILIYDYFVQQWSTHQTLTFNDSTIYRSLHTGLQPNGQVLEQTQGQWTDITSPDPLSLTTGWFEFAQFQGYQRVKEFLFTLTSVNATQLQVQIYEDYSTTPIQTDLIPINASSIPQQFRIFPAFQKCTAMQIVITEVPTGAQAGGILLSGLMFIMAIKTGINKLPAVQAYG